MITLRRAEQRRHVRRRKQEVWLTFFPHDLPDDPLVSGFGALEMLNEDRLPPGGSVTLHAHHDGELVTYVCEGALAQSGSTDATGVLSAGEFQRMSVERGVRHHETNASATDATHVFQIWLRTSAPGSEPKREQKRFSAAARRGALCVVASPDGRRGSLVVHEDVVIHSALLEPGKHIVHELTPGRSAWLHVVRGQATLGAFVLCLGDGAGITDDRAVSFTAREETEVLLLDFGSSPGNGGVA
jgi:quercetin 2,3-dioxygenase